MKDQNLIMIVETLADMVIDANKKEVRDIYSLAIKSTIQELKESAASTMIKTVYPKLMKGLIMPSKNEGADEVKEECLDILTEIFKKFGGLLHKNNNLVNKDELMKCLFELLVVPKDGVRKKVTNCLGQFAIILSNRQLQALVNLLIDRLQKSANNKQDMLILIQCISQIARTVGSKL